jgi:hypothetical protein
VFRVQDSGSGLRIKHLGFKAQSLGFKVQGLKSYP